MNIKDQMLSELDILFKLDFNEEVHVISSTNAPKDLTWRDSASFTTCCRKEDAKKAMGHFYNTYNPLPKDAKIPEFLVGFHMDENWHKRWFCCVARTKSRSGAQKKARELAKAINKKIANALNKNISSREGVPLKQGIGEDGKTPACIGDLCAYARHTYGQGWIWRIDSEDSNDKRYRTLTLVPVFCGVDLTMPKNPKVMSGVSHRSVEPIDIVALGKLRMQVDQLIKDENRRKGSE